MTLWTEDRVRRLQALWREDKTAAFIARALGPDVSRSAVLGKIHRLKLSLGRTPASAKAPPPHRLPARRGRAPKTRVLVAPIPAPAAETTGLGRRTILTVGRLECRWPFGDPKAPGFSLCGHPIVRGAFCAGHAAVAYRHACTAAESLARREGLR